MVGLTQAHHDWVKDALNVDPMVYTPPDEDVEQELTSDLVRHSTLVMLETGDLFKEFSNSVHESCKRARDKMGELYAIAAIAWDPADAKGGAALLAKSAPPMTKEDRAILDNEVAAIKDARDRLVDLQHEVEAIVRTYAAAITEINALPRQVNEPPPANPDLLDANGDVIEHVWDFVNSITQITFALSDLHLFAGMDLIKDALKADQMQKQIDAINGQLDDQRAAINGLIAAAKQRAVADAENAFLAYGHKMDALKKQVGATQAAIARFDKHLKAFSSSSKGKGGKPALSKEAQAVLRTYNAVLDASTASTVARQALNTKTLSPTGYKKYFDQMVPLGKPITDDARTEGGCIFHKGGALVKYTTTSKVTEALASGIEIVASIYEDAPKIDRWYAAWSAAMAQDA